jgi:hypothetical protein
LSCLLLLIVITNLILNAKNENDNNANNF